MPFDPEVAVALGAVFAAAAIAAVLTARRRRSADAARAYLQGFRYILSDEPDAAVEELTRAAQMDARTIETYFALGALFRRTGEYDRAIRLHQNMLLRKEVEPEMVRQMQLELALDYQRAGMLERAVHAYEQVLASSPRHAEALLRLRQVHEERRDFAQAAAVQGRLVELGEGGRSVLAHLLAEASLAESDGALALQLADRGVEIDPHSAHASFARGLSLLKQQRPKDAAGALMKACVLDPEIAARAAEPLLQATQEGGGAGAIDFFAERLRVAGDHAALRLAMARCLRQLGRVEEAVSSLRRALDLDPRFLEARVELGRTLLDPNLSHERGAGDVRREFEALLAGFGSQTPGFACRACGQGYAESHFRCGRCLGWDTIRRGPPPEPGMLREAPHRDTQARERADGK